MEGRRDFHHPYKPYDIQYDLMCAIYDCISNKQVGIFESPTGTGKSLSLICGSLTWLRDFQSGTGGQSGDEKIDDNQDEPSWVTEQTNLNQKTVWREQRIREEKRLSDLRKNSICVVKSQEHGVQVKRKKRDVVKPEADIHEEDFVLDEYYSEDDNASDMRAPRHNEGPVSAATLQLMDRLGENPFEPPSEDDYEAVEGTKIYYCSRTHSQLTQFVQELRRVKWPISDWGIGALKDVSPDLVSLGIKHVPLASRKSLCINDKVLALGSVSVINERCLELQDAKPSKEHKCPFLPKKESKSLVNDFKDRTLAKIQDIEEIGSLGKTMAICPYYASRSATTSSEVISLPYQLLLQKSARDALGISLKGHVVIVDEAHNLSDTIANMSSVTLTSRQLKASRLQLGIYLQRFGNRLKGSNRVYVVQTMRVIESMIAYIGRFEQGGIAKERIASVDEMMAGRGMDQVNLHKLLRYLHESKLARKVHGYQVQTSEAERTTKDKSETPTAPVLTAVQGFLASVINPASEGRFFCSKADDRDWSLKYMLLDPSPHFREVVEDARAVILAGGTMSPMTDYTKHLFSYVEPGRLATWSCGHIIPKENLTVRTVARGPDGTLLDFSFEKRQDPAIIASIGFSLLQLVDVVPDGLVVFFPSYSYLDNVVSAWKAPAPRRIWDRLCAKKPIFQESKALLSVEDMLREYSKSVDTNNGGLLLSVIGGKLSEGINFSDRLGRGVAVVGLPFPDARSAHWRVKMEYLEQKTVQAGGTIQDGKAAAQEFYVNACMRAVNQSIGRAIRHKADFASILLLDRRYDTTRISEKLPAWIKQGLVDKDGERPFFEKMDDLRAFFAAKGTN